MTWRSEVVVTFPLAAGVRVTVVPSVSVITHFTGVPEIEFWAFRLMVCAGRRMKPTGMMPV